MRKRYRKCIIHQLEVIVNVLLLVLTLDLIKLLLSNILSFVINLSESSLTFKIAEPVEFTIIFLRNVLSDAPVLTTIPFVELRRMLLYILLLEDSSLVSMPTLLL